MPAPVPIRITYTDPTLLGTVAAAAGGAAFERRQRDIERREFGIRRAQDVALINAELDRRNRANLAEFQGIQQELDRVDAREARRDARALQDAVLEARQAIDNSATGGRTGGNAVSSAVQDALSRAPGRAVLRTPSGTAHTAGGRVVQGEPPAQPAPQPADRGAGRFAFGTPPAPGLTGPAAQLAALETQRHMLSPDRYNTLRTLAASGDLSTSQFMNDLQQEVDSSVPGGQSVYERQAGEWQAELEELQAIGSFGDRMSVARRAASMFGVDPQFLDDPDVGDQYASTVLTAMADRMQTLNRLVGGSVTTSNPSRYQPGESVARPLTQADFDALPSGAAYIDPSSGRTFRKP